MTTISPPIPLPISSVKWRIIEPAQVNRSAWTGRRKVIGLPGAARWTATVDMQPVVGEANMLRWRGWIASLRGSINTFPLRAVERQQTTATNPYVGNGANANTTLPLTNLPVSTTVLKAGQFMTVSLPTGHKRLVCLTSDLVSNSLGNAIAAFAPELGEAPFEGAMVEIQYPYALMALNSDPAGWDVARGQLYTFTLDCEEAL